jgi:hypothetical protein
MERVPVTGAGGDIGTSPANSTADHENTRMTLAFSFRMSFRSWSARQRSPSAGNRLAPLTIALATGCSLVLLLVLSGSARAADCYLLTIAGIVPIGFGAPFDVLSPYNEPLVTGDCTEQGIQVQLGSDYGDQVVYHRGYVLRKGEWQPVDLAGRAKADDPAWLHSGARTTIALAAEERAGTIFMLVYTCQHIGGFIKWKCGCRHYYCEVPMWQLQEFRYGATPPQPIRTDPAHEPVFEHAGEIRPDGSMILLDGRIKQTTNFWTRELPKTIPADFTSPVDYTNGRMDVRLELFSVGKVNPAVYEICFENGTHGMDGWGETCTHDKKIYISAPGIYQWTSVYRLLGLPVVRRRPVQWWRNARGFDWAGGAPKRITINYRTAYGEIFPDDALPYDLRLTIIFTPAGRPFAGF